ncbi:P-loop containing nucleoside triphosphate hydrolase protein [Cantharellus anzutake]|uniref:P-loop containing nucleoside triphosphate hydrolase protein n=1 Tax=Cantharellus anzutake TaxID=1750568 RepID=UPI001908733F|nr:P-loop containing nucleoside triphosphate hydrolase protein [Cantharellus anzutake]KAF8343056.1 P-loop containing nucleoside triphosphate hydrolase protein [Cantharellus anzutake]
MPLKSVNTVSTPATRASSRLKTSVTAPDVPSTTRTTRAAAAALGTSRTSATLTASEAQNPGLKRLKPLGIRGINSKKTKEKDNDLAETTEQSPAAVLAATRKALRPVSTGIQEEREAMKAYLRVRPDLDEDPARTPYLKLISEAKVQLSPPSSSSISFLKSSISRLRAPASSSRTQTFSFTRVFEPSTTQSDFFQKTTLPLVKDLLNMENGLVFAYGVTNSGKTYTIQGKHDGENPGILPRAIDVVFNSIGANQEEDDMGEAGTSQHDATFVQSLLTEEDQGLWKERDETVLPIDDGCAYAVYISYAEIYNNQIFDLLSQASSIPQSSSAPDISHSSSAPSLNTSKKGSTLIPTLSSLNPFSWLGSNSSSLRSGASSSSTTLAVQNTGTTTVSRQALSVRINPVNGTKYIASLKEVCVRSANEAKEAVRMGMLGRRVFGTIANRESSRSHAILGIRIERRRKDDRSGVVETAKMSIVDLAGSERNKNTQATGDRMDEANKINNSLMALGQCMRTLRCNQMKLVKAKASGSTRPVRLEVPMYRTSKLTELFQEFFEGRGRAVMIVNVNPFDTGYHENATVMEFAALASEVSTNTTKLPLTTLRPTQIPVAADSTAARKESLIPQRLSRQVRVSLAAPGGGAPVERVIEVVEEAEEKDPEEEEDEEDDPDSLVSILLRQLEEMRERWYEAEIRCAMVEAETRESVMQEMEERMQLMERKYAARLRREIEENELKMDRKIEMLSRTGVFGEQGSDEETEEEDIRDVEVSLLMDTQESTPSPTPPARINKSQKGSKREHKAKSKTPSHPDEFPNPSPLVSEDEAADTDGCADIDSNASDDDYVPTSRARSLKKGSRRRSGASATSESSARSTALDKQQDSSFDVDDTRRTPGGHTQKNRVASTSQGRRRASTKEVKVPAFLTPDDSMDGPLIIQNPKARIEARAELGPSGQYVPDVGEPGTVKKKKRHLGVRGKILNEDDILQVTAKAVSVATGSQGGMVRRLASDTRKS